MATKNDIENVNSLINTFTDPEKAIRRIILKKNVLCVSIEYLNDTMEHFFFDQTEMYACVEDLCSVFFTPCKATQNHPTVTLFRNNAYA